MRRVSILAAVLALVLGIFPTPAAYASTGCNATITPDTISPGNESTLQFDIQNTGSDPALWIQIQRPTVSYSVNGATQSGWTDATDDNGTTLTGGQLDAGGSFSLQLAMFTAPQEEPASAWSIQVSANADGSGAVACGGQIETTIGTPPTPPTPNGESGIGLTNVTPTTATVAWTSDVPSTSYVYYGTSDSYGSTATTPGSDTGHSVLLTGLAPSTIYHYMVAGSDDSANNLFSGDNTFITPAAPPPPLQPVIIINNLPGAPAATQTVVPKVPGDTTAPSVAISTSLNHPFAAPPVIRGTATDNGALASIQYSTDGGHNWLPVAAVTGIATGSASFSFTPFVQEDGNYQILVDAIDSNGNIGSSAALILVIDRLPPQIGPMAVSYGPEVLSPAAGGAMELLAGSSYHLTTSAIGGATSITLEAQPQEQLNPTPLSFSLSQSPDDGLWRGVLTFKAGGIYQLVAKSLDGAGNRTSRTVMTIAVTPAGRILEANSNKPLTNAKLSLYMFESSTSSWQLWDGAPYGQKNPQTTAKDGSYSLSVPAGKYYLKIEAPGRRTFTSNALSTSSSLALASTVALSPSPVLTLGPVKIPLPDISWQSDPLPDPLQKPIAEARPLTGQALPAFSLPTAAGGHKSNIDLEGRPTDLVMLSTWMPAGQTQLPALAQVQANSDVNVAPVFSQEHVTLVSTYLAIAGYSLTSLVDPDGLLVPPLQVGPLPQHIFVDRTGRIKKVMVGVLSKDDILAALGGL